MKLKNAFTTALIATLGVGVGLLIWGAATSLTTVLTYIGAALFLALGIEPIVRLLQSKKVPRWAALSLVFFGLLVLVIGIILIIVPTLVDQTVSFIQRVIVYFNSVDFNEILSEIQKRFDPNIINVEAIKNALIEFISDFNNIAGLGTGVIDLGVGIASGLLGALVITVLTIYFTASLDTLKKYFYSLVPATKRQRVSELTEKITESVGGYIGGQVTLASINGIASFIFLTILATWFGGSPFAVVLAFTGFLFALIPLIGTGIGSLIIIGVTFLLGSPTAGIIAAIYYMIYMSIDAYIIVPNVMKRAVSVPSSVVIIAALAGGTLLGILGALIAIPVAASILLLLKEVVIPKQNSQ